jgi:hypothetical protein
VLLEQNQQKNGFLVLELPHTHSSFPLPLHIHYLSCLDDFLSFSGSGVFGLAICFHKDLDGIEAASHYDWQLL